ncbi:MAG: cysteine desulfurase [Rhodospirillales bacterium]|nr:cysteine desulfurase [Rhodospirillales bacterium]
MDFSSLFEVPFLLEWATFLLRWLHVITAIAWIGSSFYFIALDASLKDGEAWQVHGGGFYRMKKYLVAPPELPEHLTWFKWESYSTWISGFFLLATLYYGSASLFLIDPATDLLTPWQAIGVSLAGLAIGWFLYDSICTSEVGSSDRRLIAVLFVLLLLAAYFYGHVFSGRGAFMQVGATIATWMTANVFLVIIPNQKRAVAMLLNGETPPAWLGKRSKQRSLHNNYLTLPVVFLMLSNHNPLAFATRFNWVIIGVLLIAGAVIRHFFNERHAGRKEPWWCWGVAGACVVAIVGLSLAGAPENDDRQAELPATRAQLVETVQTRCVMCHAAQPAWPGLAHAPRGVRLDSEAEIVRHLAELRAQAGLSRAMPPGNLTEMTQSERALLRAVR